MAIFLNIMRLAGEADRNNRFNNRRGVHDNLNDLHEQAATGWRWTQDEIERQEGRRR